MSYQRNERARRALLKAAGTLDWRRIRGVLGRSLSSAVPEFGKLPDSLIDVAIVDGDVELLTKVLANRALTAEQLEAVFTAGLTKLNDYSLRRVMYTDYRLRAEHFQTRLAATGHPGLVEDVNGTDYFDWDKWQILLAAATDQAAAAVMLSNTWSRRLRTGVVSPIPEVVWHVLRKLGAQLSVAEQLTAVRSLLAADVSPGEVIADVTLRPEVSAILAELAEGAGSARLDAALSVAEGTEGLIAELYDRDVTDIDELIKPRNPIDWAALTAAARRKPFTKDAAGALVAQKDCPDALRDILFKRHPAMVVENAARLGPSLLGAECPPRSRPKATREILAEALGDTVSGTDALQYGRPAREVLESLRPKSSDGSSRTAAKVEFRAALGALFAEWPVADVDAWHRVHTLLPEFGGTVSELLDAARQDPTGTPVSAPAWELASVSEAFLALLDAAPVATHVALLPMASNWVKQALFRTTWRPEWVDMAVASGDPEVAEWVASRWGLDAEEIDRLASVGTDEVILALLRQRGSTRRQREAWLSDPSPRLRQWLHVIGSEYWRLSDLVACSDPGVHKAIGEYNKYLPQAKGTLAQLRVALDIWQEDGPELVRRVLSADPFNRDSHASATAVLTELLERPDTETALTQLRDKVHYGESVAAQIEAWRSRKDFSALAEEHHVWHWDALEAAHAAQPFSNAAVYRMASMDGCPAGLREVAKTILPPRSHRAYTALMSGKDPAKVLRANPADDTDRSLDPWIPVAIAKHRLTWEDVLSHAHPAACALEFVENHDGRQTKGDEVLLKLVADRLGDNTEAWLLAVQMLSDFPGTVEELLATAVEAVS